MLATRCKVNLDQSESLIQQGASAQSLDTPYVLDQSEIHFYHEGTKARRHEEGQEGKIHHFNGSELRGFVVKLIQHRSSHLDGINRKHRVAMRQRACDCPAPMDFILR